MVKLPEVSVTATRSEQALEKLPRNVTVITREEIDAMHPQTVTELLKGVPGLVVRDFTGTGASASIDMRGFGETGNLHTLVTVDGRRLNQIDLSGVDFTTIPVENIERIEILHGPAGVLYGDSAVGGVVNIVTREGAGKPSAQTGGPVRLLRALGGEGQLPGLHGQGLLVRLGPHYSNDGYRENSETRLKNATFNTRYDTSPTLSFLVDGVLNQANYSLPGALTEAQMNQDRRQSVTPNNWANNRDYSLRGQARKEFGENGTLTADLSYRQRKAESEMWSKLDSNIDVWGLQPKYVLDGKLGGLGHRLTAGIDYFKWDMNSDTYVIGGSKTGSTNYKLDSSGPLSFGGDSA